MNREWKVSRNGKLYTDRFDSEDEAYEYIAQLEEKQIYGDYTVEEMTQDEIDEYYE